MANVAVNESDIMSPPRSRIPQRPVGTTSTPMRHSSIPGTPEPRRGSTVRSLRRVSL